MSEPPPIPPRDASKPPPLPKDSAPRGRWRAADGRRKGIVIALIAVGATVGFFVLAIVAVALIFGLTAREFEVTETIRECVVTAKDLEEWFEVEARPEFQSWDGERYIDRSVQLYYFYEDPVDSIYLNCNLTEEPKVSDAIFAYEIEWGGLNLGNRIGESVIELESADEVFRWGDRSRFAYQLLDGERYGFAFVGRKGGKVFFVDCWGVLLEDREDVAAFLQPHLDAFEAISLMDEASPES